MKKVRLSSAILAGGFAVALAGSALAADTVKIAAQEPGGSWY